MSGRIWVVELQRKNSLGNGWAPFTWEATRSEVRSTQNRVRNLAGFRGYRSRVVQYVRQGGAR